MAKKNETMKPIVITLGVVMQQRIVTDVRFQATKLERYMDQKDQSKLPGAVNENSYSCGDKVAKPQTTCNKAIADGRETQTMCNKVADEPKTQTMCNKVADERKTQTMCNNTVANENIILDGCYNVLENSTMVYELSNAYFVFENGETRIGKQVYSIENAGSSYILRLNTEPQQTVFFSNQDESIVFPDLDKLYDACKEKWFQNSHQEKLTRAANFFKNRGM